MHMYNNPPHPGVFLKEKIIESHKLTITTPSKIPGATRSALPKLLNGRAFLSPEMALRFEMAFGLEMYTFLKMQTSLWYCPNQKKAHKIKIERHEAQA